MDRNTLKSVAIYGMPSYYTNLRVLSDYPGIFFLENFQIKCDRARVLRMGSKTQELPQGLRFLQIIQIEQNIRE